MSSANILFIATKPAGIAEYPGAHEVVIRYRYFSASGMSSCLTPSQLILSDDPFLEALQPAIDFAINVLDLKPVWEQASPLLVDFQGKTGGLVKIKLGRDTDWGKQNLVTPWLDYMKSDFDEDIAALRQFAADCIRSDESLPSIAGDDQE
jgi:hypothetical protein